MELPIKVLVHNEILGIKGSSADLLNISPHGYYEVNLKFLRGHKIRTGAILGACPRTPNPSASSGSCSRSSTSTTETSGSSGRSTRARPDGSSCSATMPMGTSSIAVSATTRASIPSPSR